MVEAAAWTATSVVLALAFLTLGFAHYLGAHRMVNPLKRWGHPGWWPVLAGLVEIGGAVLVAVPGTRLIGLAVLLSLVALASVYRIRARAIRPALASIGLATMLAACVHQAAIAG